MNAKFLFLVSAFVVGGGLMIFQATQTGAAPVLMPSDLVTRQGSEVPRVRVAGRVSNAGEIVYDTSPKAVLRFRVEDPKHPERGSVPVLYEGVRPDMFAIGRDVIIDGGFDGETLVASSLLTQCPSKYEAPDPDKLYGNKQGDANLTGSTSEDPGSGYGNTATYGSTKS